MRDSEKGGGRIGAFAFDLAVVLAALFLLMRVLSAVTGLGIEDETGRILLVAALALGAVGALVIGSRLMLRELKAIRPLNDDFDVVAPGEATDARRD